MAEPHSPDQAFIRKLTDIVLSNLEDKDFGVKKLASKAGIPQHSLIRKLHEINKKTITQFIREVRLEKAKELLQNEDQTASEISFLVGFSSPAYFNKCFHEYFGYPPGKAKRNHYEDTRTDLPDDNSIQPEHIKFIKIRTLYSILLLFLLVVIVVGYFLYPKFSKTGLQEDKESNDSRISVAVMPFYNMTRDTSWNIWQGIIQECLISALCNNKELKVRQKESINALLQSEGITEYASITPAIASKISRKLDANLFINGSIKKAGPILRFDAQLTDMQSKEVIQSFTVERLFKEENILDIIDTIAMRLKNYLLISKLISEDKVWKHYGMPNTNSPEALRYCMYGSSALSKGDNANAISWFLKALEADSNYYGPMQGLSSAYAHMGMMEQNYKWVEKSYSKRNQFSFNDQLWASWTYAFNFEPLEKSIEYLRQLQQLDDQSPNTYYLIGITYNMLKQYDKAIPELEKNLEISRKWGKEFLIRNSAYLDLALAYHKTGQYNKEKNIYKLEEKYISDDPVLLCRQSILALTEKDTVAANRYFEKYIVVHRQRYPGWESEIPTSQGWIYSEAGYPDKAEIYLRKSISMDPENPERLHHLATLFIDYNRKLADVQGLMDKAMALASNKVDYYRYMETKGWGLYKQGRSKEALGILQKIWDSAPFHVNPLTAHLLEVKKAVANPQLSPKIF
jgi:AraC-like DNA-binding protein/tetratricopeptide (TPR) repeat protein